jgi:hypothetical protein
MPGYSRYSGFSTYCLSWWPGSGWRLPTAILRSCLHRIPGASDSAIGKMPSQSHFCRVVIAASVAWRRCAVIAFCDSGSAYASGAAPSVRRSCQLFRPCYLPERCPNHGHIATLTKAITNFPACQTVSVGPSSGFPGVEGLSHIRLRKSVIILFSPVGWAGKCSDL